ncbi:unnamed protein product [Caenorhabditis sp. 36 PRJEB53466]|nr:unnamed protein product [Caenorhabditis sp. 36 PRJEB53466]
MAGIESINKLVWFHGLLPREEVKLLLAKNGDFLVRMSEPSPGQSRHLVLSVMANQDDPNRDGAMHYVIRTNDGRYSITDKDSYNTLVDLINHHKTARINEEVVNSLLINAIPRQSWELNHDDVTMTKTLGEGAFGEVRLGTLKTPGRNIDVAVKCAKLDKCTKEQIKEITTEARLMRNFDHRNVVRCYGVAAIDEPLLVVMELVQGGGLDSYLTKNSVLWPEKMDVIGQVAAGLAYIHSKMIMHRDIAARNVLYGNGTAKVSDFGLSRVGAQYQMDPNKKAPIRWLSPETLQTFLYTQATDVFSFGVLCWEVIENGTMPYPGMLVAEVHAKVVKEDYRMAVNPAAPEPLKELIRKCWLRDPLQRMTMEQARLFCATSSFTSKTKEPGSAVKQRSMSVERAKMIGLSDPRKEKTGFGNPNRTNRRLHNKKKLPSSAPPSAGSGSLSNNRSLSLKVTSSGKDRKKEGGGEQKKKHKKRE